jgi:hypothetical protein
MPALNTCQRRAFLVGLSRADEPIAAYAASAQFKHYEESWRVELFRFEL